ncbi:MAG: GGDEF domain-containing protein [Velocimicrobium sp.]
MKLGKELEQEFYEILEERLIYPVYQPIVSLEDGSIFGYEALSRISKDAAKLDVGSLFKIAEECGKVWELEGICRKESLRNACNKPSDVKLFLNVDPKVIHDEKFKAGLTYQYLKRYRLRPDDIIFEITERSSIEDVETFKQTIQHYKNQKFKIAIDDFGEGYAGVNRICAILPDYIKLDMEIVRDIHKSVMKQMLVKNMVCLCEEIGAHLIAEGIETEEELKELIRLEIPYGQGYFLQPPTEKMVELSKECMCVIMNNQMENIKSGKDISILGNIGTICKVKDTTALETQAKVLYEYVSHNPTITEICVLNKDNIVVGICTRLDLFELFGGRYGYNLNLKRTAKDIMNSNFLMVDCNTSIETVSQMALIRPIEHLYDAVVVTQNGRYMGVVTVKDLLETVITIQVSRAVDANPLTGLPGNRMIEKYIYERIINRNPFSIIYLDLDNFKAYNDTYGFNKGDLMIKIVATCMENCCEKNEFKGHIGGDDFVIICDYWEVEELCKKIIERFMQSIPGAYNEYDWNNQYIISKNRNGSNEKFPIISLSIAVATNKQKKYHNLEIFSSEIAHLKKKCKQKEGNYYCII